MACCLLSVMFKGWQSKDSSMSDFTGEIKFSSLSSPVAHRNFFSLPDQPKPKILSMFSPKNISSVGCCFSEKAYSLIRFLYISKWSGSKAVFFAEQERVTRDIMQKNKRMLFFETMFMVVLSRIKLLWKIKK